MKSLSSTAYKFVTALMMVVLALGVMPVSPAFAADTGLQSPTACATGGWTTAANAVSSNNLYATANAGANTLICTYNIPAIPAGATINGIEVLVEGLTTGRQAAADLSWDGGATYTFNDPNTTLGGVESTLTLGGAGITWNRGWAVGDFTGANFRVRLTSSGVGGGTISVDHIQVRVTYTLPVPTTTIGDGTSPANKTVGGSAVNVAASAFTLSTNIGSDTVTDLVVTGTNTANVATNGVKIYRDNGGTANEWDATDTLVGTASFTGTTATFTGINLPATTTSAQYIITYDLIAAPTNGQTLTAFVSGATATNAITNTDNTDATITIDSSAPSVTSITLQNPGTSPTNADTLTFRVVFSETVVNVSVGDFYVNGTTTATVTNVTVVTGTAYNVTVSGGDLANFNGVVGLNLSGAQNIVDTVGNALPTVEPATDQTYTVDNAGPTLTINQAVGQTDPASTTPINFAVVFNETVTGFTNADVTLGGTAGATTVTISGAGPAYNVAVSGMTNPGTVTITIAANRVTDTAGNNNVASTNIDNSVTLNGFTLTSSVGPGTNGGTGTINPNGTTNVLGGASQAYASTPNVGSILSNFIDNSFSYGAVNNFTISNVDANHTVVAIFDGGWSAPTTSANGAAACGGAGNAFTSNNSFTTCGAGDSAIYSNFNLNIPAGSTINYVEVAIEGHTDGRNLAVSISTNGGLNFFGALPTNFASEPAAPDKTQKVGNRPGDDWQLPFTPASFSNPLFRVQVTGMGGGSTFSLDQLQVKVNYTLPPVTINQAVGQVDPTNTSPINFTVVFPYPVTDFATGDVTLAGTAGATTAVVTGSGTTYNVAVSGMTLDGTVIASIAAGVAHDANGIPSTSSTSTDNTVTYNATAPTATIDLQDASDSGVSFTDNITNAVNPVFDVTFNEDLLSAPTNGDFTNAGSATGCSFTVGTLSGNTYPVTASGCSEGTLILRLTAGAVTDTSTNPNAQTDGPTVTIDRTNPDVAIDQAAGQADPTGASPINFTAVFSESVFGFTGLDLTLSGTANPTVANVTGGPATYTVAVSNMTTSGPGLMVTASIGAGVATDAAGNPNTASTSTDNSVEYNSNAPIVSINLQTASDSGISNVDNITNVASPVFDVAFDEAVTGLANNDFSNVGTATACTFAVGAPTGNTYPVTVSGCSNGTLIVQLAAGAVQNGTLIPNNLTTGPTVSIDRTGPTVTVNQAVGQPDPTNILPISFTAAFNETVYNFTSGDVTLVAPAGAAVTLIGTGPTYGVDVSGLTADGTVNVSIAAGVATDAAGNNNTASTSTDNTVTYDTVAPTVTIDQAIGQVDPTNTSPINFTVTFSEPVTGFATGDVTLSGTANALIGTVTGGPTVYNVAVSGMANSGTVIADIAAGVATDLAGTDNTATNPIIGDHTVTYDITKPDVTIDQAVGQADPTNVSPIHFTAEFSKPVNAATFTNGDITLSSGTATITQVNATTFDISISGMSQGPLTAGIPAGGVSDLVGNTNTASTSADNVVVYDTAAPTVTINQAVGQADPTNISPIHFTAIFSEPVNGFTSADVTLSSGTATLTGGPTVYDVSVTGMAQGVLTATIPANSVTDDVGIANTASTSTDNSVLYDSVAPTVTVNKEATQADPTNTGPINFTVVFSEPVTGFTNADLVGNFSGTAAPTTAVITTGSGTTYNVAISGMAADGTVTLSLPVNVAQDATGNNNTASTSTDNSVIYDTTRPTVTINQAAGQADPTSTSPINFTVVFSEPVSGFTSAGINLTGTAGATTALVTGGPTTYNVAVSGMVTSGTVTPFVFVNATQDAAGNSSFASTSSDNTVTYDNAALTVTINQDAGQSDPTGTAPINFAVIFNKPINASTFIGVDVDLTGSTAPGTLTAVITGSGSTYNVAVSGMTGSGTVVATIPVSSVQDIAGNSNLASTSVDNIVTFDAAAPSVTVNQGSLQADPTNGTPINFTVVFSEAVTGFTSADVVTAGSTAPGALVAAVTGGGTTYNVAISGMTGSGTVLVTIPANAATDVSSNGNTASTSTDNVVNYDVTAPTVTINQAAGQADPTGASPINFTVIFSESVSNFVTGDVTLSGTAGATTAVVTGGGTTYNVAVSGMTVSGDVTASILAGMATDTAGNANTISSSTDSTVVYDNAALSVTINQATGQTDPTNASPINFTVVFSKPVGDFTAADVVLSGVPAGALTVNITQLPPNDGTTYNVAVSGLTVSRTVIANIPANAAHDVATNGNSSSTTTDNTVTYDVTAPTVTINQAVGQADPTNASPIDFTVVFSEPVTGFATGDVTFTGSTAGGTLIGTVTGSGTTYNVAVSGMTSNGTVIASILAGVATDAAGNTSVAGTFTDNTVTFDNAALTVTINQAAGQVDPTNVRPINFTVVFSKPVTGFANADVVLIAPAGAAATVTGASGGTTYNVAVTGMTTSGTVTASILAGAAQDATNASSAASTSTDNTVTYDVTLPTVTINQAAGQVDPTNAAPINFTVVFSEPVTGFAAADVALSGAPGTLAATVTLVSGNTYNVAVNGMTGSGTVVATIAAGGVQDLAGNTNTGSTSTDNAVTYDVTAPTVTINQALGQADPTNGSPIDFTVVFSEPVTGFVTGDVTFTGSTVGGTLTGTVTGSGTTYNVAVSGMTSNGTVIASILAGVATDATGNTSVVSTFTDNTVTFDNAVLTVTINQAAGQVDPTNASPINFTVVFSKPVTGFANADIVLSAPAGAVVNVSGASGGTTYNVAVSGMTGSGTVIASILAGAAQDASGTLSNASTSADNSVIYDVTVPTVTINRAVAQADPTNTSPINFTVVFSEPVTGFTNAGIALSGTAGATTVVVTGTGATYNVAVSGMTGSGTVIATVAAGNAQDAAGNSNANSTSTDNNVQYDATVPTVTINQGAAQADPTNVSPIIFDVVFSKSVTGFTSADITLGGTAGATTAVVTGAGTTYSVAVSGMTVDGTVIATIAAGVATDAVGNLNTASTSTDNTVQFGITAPTVTINQAVGQADPTNASPINFVVVFSKPVTGFTNADVSLSGTAGANTVVVTGSGANYNVAVSGMTLPGTVIAVIPAGAAQDITLNGNTASTSTDNSVLYDVTAPTVTINQAAGQVDPTGTSPINFTVVFSESVTGFTGADVALTGSAGATTAVVTGGGTTYNVAVSGMTASGTVIATIPAGNAQDVAGNGNASSTSSDNSVTFDFTAPSVTINQAAGQADPTNASPIVFDVIFSKSVSGFANTDVALGGTAGATTAVVAGSGATYTVTVTGMTSNGTVIASIPAGAVTDSVGNANTVSTSTDNTVTYDTVGPTVTINQAAAQADPTGTSPINFTVVFSEPVTGFTNAALNVAGTSGPTTAVVTGSGTTYNVAVSGMSVTGTVFVTITDSAGTDAAGNLSAASTSTDNNVTYDTGAPTVTVNQAAGQVDPTNAATINFTVVFNKPVFNFANTDITLTGTAGATTSVVTGTGPTYNVAVSNMSGSGTVIVSIQAGRAQDIAGNNNLASTSTDNVVTYDISAPTATINQASAQADPTNSSPVNFTVEFNEPVFGFTSTDITLGGTAGATTAVVTGSGTIYNVAVSGMVTDGTVTAALGAGAVTDVTGNSNTAATSTDNEVTFNTTNPTVLVDKAAGQGDPTNLPTIDFTVTFSELVVGFTNTDVVLGGTAGANNVVITGAGPVYTVTVSGMTKDGTVTVSIPASAVTDPSNNPNPASTAVTITYLDGVGPSVQLVNTTPETADHVLSSPETVTFDITQFKVTFNQPVFDPQGDSAAEDVTNPNNYMLIRDLGDTGGLQTVSCVAGAVVPADTQIAIGTVTYDSRTYTATFTVNGGLPLSNGDYHLFVCGTTSIVDPLNNTMALVGSSGNGGTDYRHSFTVSISGNGGGGGGGNEGNGGNGSASTAKVPLAASGFLIPVTGFSPNEVTMLPVQPEDRAYSSMDNITIEIPSLGIKFPIVGVSVTDNGWNLTWLKDNVGYLESSAYPTFNGNTVLTAHVRDANKNLGPFSDIKGLQLGDKILLHAYGKVYVYEVQENTKISPKDIETAFKHEEYSWVTLVTCEDYNAKIEEYYHRRMVRAVLISVVSER